MGLSTSRRGAVRGNVKSKLIIETFLSEQVLIGDPVCISIGKRRTLDVPPPQRPTGETLQTRGQI